ncbi:Carboxylesterase NlhH [Rhodococcus erythropolis]|uniref:alpha/beta hydrolase fold domain-containing protein n=1 Tax=Rhodococcus erythropolis TaxID=1833 RepID=UPI0015576622|nr:alpha/beta hydrolase fold domain-containing protein [Rhodococcus erythropolis]PBI91914.1 Carboxylesterase NlhH [Rhodococcus erythropolis]
MTETIAVRHYCPRPHTRALRSFAHRDDWAIGDLDIYYYVCHLAHHMNVSIPSIDYRLAQEHVFPARLDAGATALRWGVEYAPESNTDCADNDFDGKSTGADLAAVGVANLIDDAISPAWQFLMFPAWLYRVYAGGDNSANPFMPPPRTDLVSRLPATYLQTADYDSPRDEGGGFHVAAHTFENGLKVIS